MDTYTDKYICSVSSTLLQLKLHNGSIHQTLADPVKRPENGSDTPQPAGLSGKNRVPLITPWHICERRPYPLPLIPLNCSSDNTAHQTLTEVAQTSFHTKRKSHLITCPIYAIDPKSDDHAQRTTTAVPLKEDRPCKTRTTRPI